MKMEDASWEKKSVDGEDSLVVGFFKAKRDETLELGVKQSFQKI